MNVNVTEDSITVSNETDTPAAIVVYDRSYTVSGLGEIQCARSSVKI